MNFSNIYALIPSMLTSFRRPPKTVLIIKTGHSETFMAEEHDYPSLGDVFRTVYFAIFLKKIFPSVSISWLTSIDSMALLAGVSEIDNIFSSFDEAKPNKYDLTINLEKGAMFCDFAANLKSKHLLGFYISGNKWSLNCNDNDLIFKIIYKKASSVVSFENLLIMMFNNKYETASYGNHPDVVSKKLCYTPKIGLNFKVGNKWPLKSIPVDWWSKLADQLKDEGYEVSWQEGADDLSHYIEWIDSCDILISTDSLGLHLAIFKKKYTIGLFGPTCYRNLPQLLLGTYLTSNNSCPIRPCYQSDKCSYIKNCMHCFEINEIIELIDEQVREIDSGKAILKI